MTRLLVLDDMPAIGRMFEEVASEFGFEVNLTTTSDEFERLMAPRHPDLIVLDLVLPGGDGLQILRFLEAAGYRGALILVSGMDDRQLATACNLADILGLAVIGAVSKPFKARTIRDLFAGVAAQDPVFAATDFRAALANAEIVLHYQPVVDMRSREVLGVEALIRWVRPEHGLTMPEDFLPRAVREGLMPDITRAALEIALADARRWKHAGVDLRVAVKSPASAIQASNFVDDLLRAFGPIDSYLPRLTLEVTETEAMNRPAHTMEAMSKLRESGVELAIEDFGAGHSSLVELRRLPLSRLKIAKSFVVGCARDVDASAITRAAIDLGHALGIIVAAEGVETQEIWDRLLELQCDAAQGQFIAHPMPGNDLGGWVNRWRSDAGHHARRKKAYREVWELS